jgi:glutamate--cysteine ligase
MLTPGATAIVVSAPFFLGGRVLSSLTERLAALSRDRIAGIRRGVEKESLRVKADGTLALTPHPAALGAPLTHPCITTDFSESLIELVTAAHPTADACIGELTRIHQFVYHELGDEMLWVGSMPCDLPEDSAIPIGRYGTSNVGRAKSVYRTGLSHRYGRRMQMIAGIHYNWSMPGLNNDDYFALIRNFRRHSFLLLYLFGASPAVCSSFVTGRQHDLRQLSEDTYYLPHATSLRMGRLGYQSDAQASLAVSYNCLDHYAKSLQEALTRPYPPYEVIGLRDAAGNYNQLATTLLQIENEFYGTIRPKRVILPDERPLHALRARGVEYVEVRLMDLNPFLSVGIDQGTTRFLDIFLLHCVLSDSPDDTPAEIAALARNQHRTAARGREDGLVLERGERQIFLVDWGREILAQCTDIAGALDAVTGTTDYRDALVRVANVLDQPEQLPSARVLSAMARDHDNSYREFIRLRSADVSKESLALPYAAETGAAFRRMAQESVTKREAIEGADAVSFEAYRAAYLKTHRLGLGMGEGAPSV